MTLCQLKTQSVKKISAHSLSFLTFTSQVDDRSKILLLHNENLAQSTLKNCISAIWHEKKCWTS